MRRSILALLFLVALFPAETIHAQDDKGAGIDSVPPLPLYVQVGKTAYHGDSIPDIVTPTCYVYPPKRFRSERERMFYNRLVLNVKKVLPYAKLAKETLIETYDFIETLPTEKERRDHIKLVEKGIKEQYKPIVRRMTKSQGKLLIKLINRECNSTSYEAIQAFMGPLRAGFWQAFAWAFGASLKKEYDPDGTDRLTERVVLLVEAGQL